MHYFHLPIVILVFALSSFAFYVIFQRCDYYQRMLRNRTVAIGGGSPDALRSPKPGTRWWRQIDRIVPHVNEKKSLQKQLARAGYYEPTAARNYVVVQAVLLGVATALSAIVMLSEWFQPLALSVTVCLVLCLLAFSAPIGWLNHQTRGRHRMLRKSIPDLLELMVVCLDAGLSLPLTLQRMTHEMGFAHPQLADELATVQREYAMGLTLEKALGNFAERTDFEGLKTLCLFTREAQKYGTNITDALRDHSSLLVGQREAAAEEMAQRASVKILLPVLLLILPAVFVVVAGPAFLQLLDAFGSLNVK
ncbi:Bacterial type II secretion system protein F domain protein [Novipirellula galeiformis]|uniref:Bacterial type II secretion system protein F domain protein n=1 Tax=Novipirellula galeiformis TaxID=2528004 RepID=A0A5C6C1R3_9BACT|nr:type II secretion system F family protein [Novipirellula galeiformis]TWU17446.1 Bacterial type II secretion system protein F domain protein [Novipirellula galeiformis]